MGAEAAILIGTAVSAIGGLIGGSKAASAAKKQAQAQNEATQRQFFYDNERWQYDKQKIIADRDQAIKDIQNQAINEGKIADYKDASNLQRYNYDLLINQRQQESLDQQYIRSEQVFNKQSELNSLEAQAAAETQYRQLNEVRAEAAFDVQDLYIKNLQEEGRIRSRISSGRSGSKVTQAQYANYGYQLAMINETVASAGRNARASLEDIDRDKLSADLAAYASKMLDPGVLPDPITPIETPRASYIMPRALAEYDFGPQPVLGAIASPSAAAGQVWGTTIANVAGSIGSGLTGYAGTLP